MLFLIKICILLQPQTKITCFEQRNTYPSITSSSAFYEADFYGYELLKDI